MPMRFGGFGHLAVAVPCCRNSGMLFRCFLASRFLLPKCIIVAQVENPRYPKCSSRTYYANGRHGQYFTCEDEEGCGWRDNAQHVVKQVNALSEPTFPENGPHCPDCGGRTILGAVQPNANQSPNGKSSWLSCCKLTPFSQCGRAPLYEDIPAVEMAVLIKVVVDRGVSGCKFLQGLDIPKPGHRSFSSPERLM